MTHATQNMNTPVSEASQAVEALGKLAASNNLLTQALVNLLVSANQEERRLVLNGISAVAGSNARIVEALNSHNQPY